MAESETTLELKKRARRRLIGAIALALTAAVVLPLVMDEEPGKPAEDIQVRIPDPQSGGFDPKVDSVPAPDVPAVPEPVQVEVGS